MVILPGRRRRDDGRRAPFAQAALDFSAGAEEQHFAALKAPDITTT
jgi:hypothetical protein